MADPKGKNYRGFVIHYTSIICCYPGVPMAIQEVTAKWESPEEPQLEQVTAVSSFDKLVKTSHSGPVLFLIH